MQKIIRDAYEYAKNSTDKGVVSDFIPEISNIDPDLLAVSLTDMDGNTYSYGDTEYRFTLQSISKIIVMALCLEDAGKETLFSKLGVEPCGDRFNDIYRLEKLNKIPSNPFINAGAIYMASCIKGASLDEKYERFRSFAAKLLGNPDLDYSGAVCKCERETAHKNRALAYMMLDSGLYAGDPEEYLELYYRGCALMVNTVEVGRFGAILAADGFDPVTKQQALPRETCDIARALMAGCGLYNSTGVFNIQAGIPAKSGSSGTIVASARKKAGIGVYSPGLDGNGNSVCGMKAISCLSDRLDLRTL